MSVVTVLLCAHVCLAHVLAVPRHEHSDAPTVEPEMTAYYHGAISEAEAADVRRCLCGVWPSRLLAARCARPISPVLFPQRLKGKGPGQYLLREGPGE